MKKKQISIILLGFILLLFWYATFKLSCISIIIPFIIFIIIFKSTYELSVTKKRCLVNCYFKKESFLYKFFTKTFFIIILSFINSLILTTILVLNIVTFNFFDFIILFFDIFFILYLYNKFINNNSLNENINNPVTKRGVALINSFILIFVFLFFNIFQTPPSYINNDLVTTIHQVSNKIYSNCYFIDYIVSLSNEIVALKWWFMIKFSINFSNKYYLKEIIWIVYLLGNYLMVYAFSKYILEILNFRRFK